MPSVAADPITPARAAVVPRGTVAGGETLPVETHVRALLRRHPIVALVGPPGAGKTMALAHLAAALSDLDVDLYDEPADMSAVAGTARPSIVAQAEAAALMPSIDLAPWGESERIDYLLVRHPTRIRAVMESLKSCDCIDALEGSPRLWASVLNAMAERELPGAGVEAFLRRRMDKQLSKLKNRGDVRATLAYAFAFEGRATRADGVPRDLQHRLFGRLAFVEEAVEGLSLKALPAVWHRLVDPELIRAVARGVEGSPNGRDALIAHLGPQRTAPAELRAHAGIVGVLVALDPAYRPPSWLRNLDYVYAPRARWSGVTLESPSLADARLAGADLSDAHLNGANLRRADLTGADLTGAMLAQANLGGATLVEASLVGATLRAADLRKAVATLANFNRAELEFAELNSADLRGASFRSATLTRGFLTNAIVEAADFSGATLDGVVALDVDFRDAILDGTHADAANFGRCRFDGMTIDRPNWLRSRFAGADLTGSRISRGTLAHANLQQAGLADVDWARCDLRGADFTHAAFHMGSSRSGLVGSTIAGEGSRTGFYGHDELEPHKHPEEIRKANLSGTDLTGALVTGTSWYLVDLRGARYTTDQAEWFRACGAILFDRA